MANDKVFQMRIDDETLRRIEYVRYIYGLKSNAEAIRKCVDLAFNNVYRDENDKPVTIGQLVMPYTKHGTLSMVVKIYEQAGQTMIDTVDRMGRYTYPLTMVTPFDMYGTERIMLEGSVEDYI